MLEIEKRRKFIMEAVISSYIDTAEPVGSGTIKRRYKINLSPASIRNVLSDLEREGYLTQPHTSAGRIPTDKGYRYYVNSLTRARELEEEEREFIEEEYDFNRVEMEEIIEKTSYVLSQITEQAGIILFPSFQSSRFKRIQLVLVAPQVLLVVLVTGAGLIKNKLVRLEEDINQDELDKMARFLNDELKDISLSEVRDHLRKKIKQETGPFFFVSRRAAEIIRIAIARSYPLRISLDGTSYILDKPEFQDIARTKAIIRLLENKEAIQKLIGRDMSEPNMKVYIGKENRSEYLNDCTFISQGYCLGKKVVGRLGVIGPRRMKYARVMSLVDYISNVVSCNLDRINR